ncbi:MAG TPA: hypothetical protein QGH18_02405 [Arenicellales bacterium]|nr:hypothetical protein [Arenicellales bacterium]
MQIKAQAQPVRGHHLGQKKHAGIGNRVDPEHRVGVAASAELARVGHPAEPRRLSGHPYATAHAEPMALPAATGV